MKTKRLVITAFAAAALMSATALTGCSSTEDTSSAAIYSTYGTIPLGELSYTINNNEITVTKFTLAATGINIPEEIDGMKVVEIGTNAFSNKYITVAVLPDSVKKISEKAFPYAVEVYSSDPDKVETANDAFANGTSLSADFANDDSVYFLDGEYSYTENENGGITITGFKLSTISAEWPEELDGAANIGSFAFSKQELINELEIPSSVSRIEDHAFYNCTGLSAISIKGNASSSGLADLSAVNSLGSWAFGGCQLLTGFTLSDSLMEIGDGAFSRCSLLSEINIPSSVESIGEYVFNSCTSLQNINIAEDNRFYKAQDGVMFNKSMTEILKCPEGKSSCIIPDSVTVIGETSLSNNISCEIPKSVKYVENRAFYNNATYIAPGPELDIPLFSDDMSSDALRLREWGF